MILNNPTPNTPTGSTGLPGPYSGPLTDDAIINIWSRRKAISQRLRLPYETQWIDNWKSYRAWQQENPDPQDWWRSNEYIPEIFNSVETVLPRMVLGMFSRPEWFEVNCPHSTMPGHAGVSCFDYERIVKSLLMAGTRRMNLFDPVFEGSKYNTIMGHVWWKLVWDQQPGTRLVDVPETDPYGNPTGGVRTMALPVLDYDDPKLSWVSNFRMWPDPTGNNDWYIEHIDTTLEKLKRINARLGIYRNLDTLEMLPPDFSKERNSPFPSQSSSGIYPDRFMELLAVERETPDMRDEGHEGTPIGLDICVGLVPYEPADGLYLRRTVIANNRVIIRDGANPTPDGKPEYWAGKQIPIPGFVYGDSVVRYAAPLNRQLNRIANYRMDEVILGIWQQYIANRNAITPNQLQFGPGGVILVDTSADVRTAFAVLERQPVLPQSYQEEAVSRDRIERTTGATAIQQGANTADRETATSVGARVQLGNERFRLAIMWQNMTFKRQLLKRMFALYQRHLPADRLVRIVGSDYRVPIDISMLQDDIDINIEADVFDVDGPLKQQAIAQLMTAAANPAFAQWLRPDQLLMDAVEASLNKDGRRYVKSAEEAAAEQQAQVFQSLAMAQMGLEPDASGGSDIASEHIRAGAQLGAARARAGKKLPAKTGTG